MAKLIKISDDNYEYDGHTIVMRRKKGKQSGWTVDVSGPAVQFVFAANGTPDRVARTAVAGIDIAKWKSERNPSHHLSSYGLRLAARQSNPLPNDIDSMMVELVDVDTRRVRWRGTIGDLDAVMRRAGGGGWTDADLYSVRSMVQDRRIAGLYVDGENILRRAKNPSKENPVDPTVSGFLEILAGHLTQYDERESRHYPNIYRLGHLLAAQQRVKDKLSSQLESSDPQDLRALRAQIDREFIVSDMPPARKTIKAIDEYLATGKAPKYPVPPKLKSKRNPEVPSRSSRFGVIASRLARGES